MVTKMHAVGQRSAMVPNIKFFCLSQTLYGPKTLGHVADHGQAVANSLNNCLSFQVSFGGVVKSPEESDQAMQAINNDPNCVAGAFWAHTFHPSMMSVKPLQGLQKPLFHLSTQWHREMPRTLCMDDMNENQTAHGNREFSHALVDLRINHHNIVGFWQDQRFVDKLEMYGRVAAGVMALRNAKIACIGGRKMNNVGVTDVAITDLQADLGPLVHDKEIDHLLAFMDQVKVADIDLLVSSWDDKYAIAAELGPKGARREKLRYAAQILLGIKALLLDGGYNGWTSNFETLGGLAQLPGLAAQELMADPQNLFGFGAEGDVQAASLLRAYQVMGQGLPGGASFSEPYTWDLTEGQEVILLSHMLEISPNVADPKEKPRLEIHPLGIGGRQDPPRLVFNVGEGNGILTSLFNLRDRGFQLTTDSIRILPPRELPNLPTARALYRSKAGFTASEECWLATGASHHPIFSTALTSEYVDIFARMLGIPHHLIDENLIT